ncbi:MAG: hypothetical protein JWO38_7639 [Gemmataceae bacterium]|nr:hypothetical protein [Gemmataceae bacterium]
MAGRRVLQSFSFWAGVVMALWLTGVGCAVVLAVLGPEPALRHPAVTLTADLSVGGWFVATSVMLLLRPAEWQALGPRVRFARLVWALGLTMHVVHVVFAFWLAHSWSHSAAMSHVKATGGFGWGIVANYLFAAVWAADVAWWWADPAGYAVRPRWVGYAVHGFLAFIVFNATVVFATSSFTREVAILLAAWVGWLLVRKRSRQ